MIFPYGPRSGVFVFSAIVTLLASSSMLRSQIVTVPPGLAPGQEYRVMFDFSGASVTSDDIAHYNTLAQAAAAGTPELAALNTTWHAVGSTATVDARDNTGTNPNVEAGVPIYTWSGNLLALDNADLWDGTWSAQPSGSGARMLWHGTGPDGTAFDAQALGYGAGGPGGLGLGFTGFFGPLASNEDLDPGPARSFNPMPIGMVAKSAHRQIGSTHDVAATQLFFDIGNAGWGTGFTLGVTDDVFLAGMMGLSGVLVVPSPPTVYVDADALGGTGARDGTSWHDAYPDLIAALANTTGPAEIWVAEGVYRPSYGLNRAETFTLVDGVDLYGGFNGTETLRTERDAEAHPTILTGDLMLNDDSGGDNSENSYHVLHCPSGSVALDGFTVQGGNTNGDASNPNGGGAYGAGSLTVSNCLFRGNRADGEGGAVYGNHSFSQCRFEDNFATGDGGAVRAGGASSLNFFDCVFVANESLEDGGGVFWTSGSVAPSFVRCTFDSNQGERGGGLYVESFGPSLLIDQCSFVGNGATGTQSGAGGHGGGGVSLLRAATLTDCFFSGNSTQSAGGGLVGFSGCVVINCVFLGNTADVAGGGVSNRMFVGDETTKYTFINCTFQGNRNEGPYGGGAVFTYDGTTFDNCVLWNNQDDGVTTSPEASYKGPSGGLSLQGVPIFTNSLAQGWDPPGAGNLDGTDLANDPLFVSPVDPATAPHLTGDLRLLATSPVLDAGDNSLISEAFDIDGLPRVQNTTVDMGAYEAIPAAEISVFDGDANELTDNGAALDLGVLRLEDLSTTVDFTIENPSLLSLTGVGITASGPSAPDVSVSVAPSSTVAAYASTAFQITLTHNMAGSVDATLAVASNDGDENPFGIPLIGVIASDMSDGDSDGSSDYQERLNGTDPGDPDSDGDGVLDGAEIDLAAFGFSEGVDDSALLAALQGSATGLGLFTESNLQALTLDRPVISRDAETGNFTIATGILQSPDLDTTPFAPLINFTPTYLPGTGELLLEFAPPNPDAHFFQIFGNVPQP